MKECKEFVMRLLHARTTTHLQHLQTRSFAKHMALGDFYEAVGDIADRFLECYQGIYGVVGGYPTAYSYTENPVEFLSELRNWIEVNRAKICDEEELQNIIDEGLELIDRTLYKLKHLS